MKWFQHDTQSHRDPFIEYLLDEYGPTGYTVFFVVLEMMGEKFNPSKPHAPIIFRLKTIQERTRVGKIDHLSRILLTLSSHPLNKNIWEVSILNGDMNGYVSLYSKKLVDNADRYTHGQIKKVYTI